LVGRAHQAALDVGWSFARAAEYSRQAIELAERHGWTDEPAAGRHSWYSQALTGQGRLEEAEPWVQRAERTVRADAEPAVAVTVHSTRGLLDLSRGRDADALAAFRAALSLDALPSVMVCRLGSQLAHLGSLRPTAAVVATAPSSAAVPGVQGARLWKPSLNRSVTTQRAIRHVDGAPATARPVVADPVLRAGWASRPGDRVRPRTGALLATVSHDLRAPLAAAKAAVSGLRLRHARLTADDRAELLATAEESLDQLADLVASLLDVSRPDRGDGQHARLSWLVDPRHPPHLGITPGLTRPGCGRRGFASS
jgi:signal transduction histidine kinase